jgi:Phytanoyl-CoA dioxygenase (PhyH)
MDIETLTDSTDLLGHPSALKHRWDEDGALFFRGVVDAGLIRWAEARFRRVLADEELIDPSVDPLIWTGKTPRTRRPCDSLGTEVWREFVKLPLLNDLMRIVVEDEPIWIPIVAHRSLLPTGVIKPDEDIFALRHQDFYFSRGMRYCVCWIPIRDASRDAGSIAVAPGAHKRGNLYGPDHCMPREAVADDEWRSADFRAGDLLMFDFFMPHAALPNPSNQIRISLDVRAIAASSPRPITGNVESVSGTDVTIRTEQGDLVAIHVTDSTYIHDALVKPRIPTADLQRIAFPGARVMATAQEGGEALLLRSHIY